jgi:GAF domain-containing protein/HAMP domain-containing protein
MAYFFNRSTETALRESANQLLLAAASQTAWDIDDFLNRNSYAISDEARLGELIDYLSLSPGARDGSPEEARVHMLLKTLFEKQFVLNPHIQGYLLLGTDGKLLVSTFYPGNEPEDLHERLVRSDPHSYSIMMGTGFVYISPVLTSEDGRQRWMYFATRVIDENRQTQGILAVQYNAHALQTLLEKNNEKAGERSYAVLLDEDLIRLAHGSNLDLVLKSVVPKRAEETGYLQLIGRLPALEQEKLATYHSEFEAALLSASGQDPIITIPAESGETELFTGAVIELQNRSWKVAFLQPESVFRKPADQQATNALFLSSLFLAISAGLAVVITRRLTSPILNLTKAAERVTAGDLWIQAPESRDEIGVLGNAFNVMTSELRRTMEGLEHRVAERTAELAKASFQAERRADQLQTIAEVAHTIASIQDPEVLLKKVTQLISERFAFYHVGIFLVDNTREYADLQAANSEGGQRMLSRNHRLKIGQEGIVGYAIHSGKARIALDVGADAVFFDNPDLPYTRSEMALPLKVGDSVIGALDVQSMEQAAFTEDDISLLGTLADQVAIAIENVRLLTETQIALTELQTLHRQYLRQEWSQVVAERGRSGFEYRFGKVRPLLPERTDEVWEKLEESGQAIILKREALENRHSTATLAAPITVRGQNIGYLNLEEIDPNRHWTKDELNLLQEVADQVGLAIENARLIEQTQQRAEREHLVASITTRMRESSDPTQILETAVYELKQALRVKQVQVFIPNEKSIPVNQPDQPENDGQ